MLAVEPTQPANAGRSLTCRLILTLSLAIGGSALAGGEDCNNNGVDDALDLSKGTSADCNGNQVPDECDIAIGLSQDCNMNGIPDACDVQSGHSEDCNGNEIPDECPAEDCNDNDLADECEIILGLVEDCNGNTLPDECDIAFGIEDDCNLNGVPDFCDDGADCNSNGILDECDIADGQSEDVNLNGIPDQCEPDCNNNDVPDDIDIGGGQSIDCDLNGVPDECEPDCNANGITDACDIADETSTDCNLNDVPDECELTTFEADSPLLGPIGEFLVRTYTFDQPPGSGSAVQLTVDVTGDFGALVETLDVTINGTPYGTYFQDNGTDCPASPDTTVIVIPPSEYNALLDANGGDLVVSFSTSSAVDATPKLCTSSVSASMSYQPIVTGDCNGNGSPDACDLIDGTSEDANGNSIPDECETCPPDVDGDGEAGFSDLLTILANWGPCVDCPQDVNGDGDVGFDDVLILLANWGPCPR